METQGKGVLLGREHLMAAEFASDDQTRGGLTGVHVKPDGTVEATNGHYAIRVPPCPMPAGDFPEVVGKGGAIEKGIVIPAATCREALKAIPRTSIPILGTAHVGVGTAEGTVVVTTTDLETASPRTVKVIDGRFPEIDNVMPADDSDRTVIGMDARYLKRIADYAIKVAGGGAKQKVIVTLSIGKPDQVMRFDVTLPGGRMAQIALMPYRLT